MFKQITIFKFPTKPFTKQSKESPTFLLAPFSPKAVSAKRLRPSIKNTSYGPMMTTAENGKF
jgi:hypothetical protein